MKNTLAENMLRFGSKNLTEENRKNLKRLTEDYVDPYGFTYKLNFKDEVALTQFLVVPEKYIKIFMDYEIKMGSEKYNTRKDFVNFITCLLYTIAYTGRYVQTISTPEYMMSFLNLGKPAIAHSTQGTDKNTAGTKDQLRQQVNLGEAIGFVGTISQGATPSTAAKEFSLRISKPGRHNVRISDSKEMDYKEWFNTMILSPMITEKAALVPTTPASAGTNPKVPVKKN
jgi:hypothetical protein